MTELTRESMLAVARARDARYDGRFLTGVLSTGIYCLPSCPARSPRDENVRHFPNEGEARAAGLRPCKRCRPDHFYRGFDADRDRLESLAVRVVEAPGEFPDVTELTRASGFGPTKLAAQFRRHFHRSPASFLAGARIARACPELLMGRRRVLDVGLDSGFSSSSSFHARFLEFTGMSPSDYRRLRSCHSFELRAPSGTDLLAQLRFQARDPESVSESCNDGVLSKAITIGEAAVALRIRVSGTRRVEVELESRDTLTLEARAEIHRRCWRMVSGGGDPVAFARGADRNPEWSRLQGSERELRVPLVADEFECLLWAVVGQQVNLPFAFRLRRRVIESCAVRAPGGELAHPSPAEVARLEPEALHRLQFSRRKAEYLIDLARAVTGGELELVPSPATSVERIEKTLLDRRGLGPWSVQYWLMRGCAFQDCAPVGDSALRASVQNFYGFSERPTDEEVAQRMSRFAPHRSLATVHFWRRANEETATRGASAEPGGRA